jgi:neutral ceramidase
MSRYLTLLALFCIACSSNTGSSDVAVDAVADDADLQTTSDIADDFAQAEDGTADALSETVELDDILRAGAAVSPVFAPLGIPTAGYGQGIDPGTPHGPFTKAFASTQRQQTPIQARAIYLSRGADELLIIRLDKIGTTAEILDEIARQLEEETGRSFDGKLIVASNHSHLGPGRLWENMVGEFANDLFWPFYYKRYVADVVAVGLAAINDAEPAEIGYGKTECPECHNDRRCENPELKDSTMWLVKVTRLDGSLKAVLINFAIHGTVFSWADYVLSGDAPGSIEQKLEETFDSPVAVLLLQSWGGDMSPANPEVEMVEPINPTIPGDYDRLDRIGYAATTHITAILDSIATSAETTFASVTARPTIDYDLVGYEEDEWNYPNGGMMCGTNSDSPCWDEEGEEPNMACIPMPPGMAPKKFTISAFHIGDLLFVTVPGEPHVDYSLEVAEAAGTAAGFDDVAVVGYCQDHWGYIMKEYDWMLGGYEPTVSFWGPKQGDYMAAQMPHVAARLMDSSYEYPFTNESPFDKVPAGGDTHAYKVMDSKGPAAATVEPVATIPPTGEALFTFAGGDPWLATPRIVLQREEGGEWHDVIRHNTLQFDNTSYLMETSLVLAPTWEEDKETQIREFLWTVKMPAKRNVPTPDMLPAGTYRFAATGPSQQGGDVTDYNLTSAPFTLE